MFKRASQKSVNFGCKNGNFSESVNSFDSGPIYFNSLGQKISRNAFVMSILFPERISHWRKGSRMHEKHEDFRDFSRFVERVRGSSGKLLERIKMPEDAFRMLKKVRRCVSEGIDFCENLLKKKLRFLTAMGSQMH